MTNSALLYIFKAHCWRFGMEVMVKIGCRVNYRPLVLYEGWSLQSVNAWIANNFMLRCWSWRGCRPFTQNC